MNALPTHFLQFFEQKIKLIRQTCINSEPHTYQTREEELCIHDLEPATEAEIKNIIKMNPNKSCELDLIPTWLLKSFIEELPTDHCPC